MSALLYKVSMYVPRERIKSVFKVTGTCDYNPDVFTAENVVAVELSVENEPIEDDQRVIMLTGDMIETVTHKEVITSASEISNPTEMHHQCQAYLAHLLAVH